MKIYIMDRLTYRSRGRKINQSDDSYRLVIDGKRIEYRRLLSLLKSEFDVIDTIQDK